MVKPYRPQGQHGKKWLGKTFHTHTHIHKTPDDNKVIAGQCGAIEAVVGAMGMHADSADVYGSACLLLQNITANGKLPHSTELIRE